jgi:hypothetical protein
LGSPKPMVALVISREPALEVIMTMTLRKSAFLPLLSVRVAWSSTWSRMLNRSSWAFSISSSSSTQVGVLADTVGEQAALVEADVARRRADQPGHGVFFHVLAHVEAHEFDIQVRAT